MDKKAEFGTDISKLILQLPVLTVYEFGPVWILFLYFAELQKHPYLFNRNIEWMGCRKYTCVFKNLQQFTSAKTRKERVLKRYCQQSHTCMHSDGIWFLRGPVSSAKTVGKLLLNFYRDSVRKKQTWQIRIGIKIAETLISQTSSGKTSPVRIGL